MSSESYSISQLFEISIVNKRNMLFILLLQTTFGTNSNYAEINFRFYTKLLLHSKYVNTK